MAKKKAAQNRQSALTLLEEYKTAYQTRNLEIQLFWQRSNYFLVLNTAIVTGVALKLGSAEPLVGVFIAFGILVSSLWYRVNLGSKFWQSRWEQKLHDLEVQLAPSVTMFSSSRGEILDDVRRSVESPAGEAWWRHLVNNHILSKPSVSRNMLILSAGFVGLYLSLLIVWIIRLIWGNAA